LRIRHIAVSNFRGIKTLSWRVKGNFHCIVGRGDSCKTTILSAIDYALSPRQLSFDDSDFFNQDVSQEVVIQVTLSEWDAANSDVKQLFQESKFAQYTCGLSDAGPVAEPQADGVTAISVSLRVDKSLEPKWFVVKGRDERGDEDRKPIYAADRAVLGLSRLDLFSDNHFTWGRSTILTRLHGNNQANLNTVLSTLSREMRQADISAHPGIAACQGIADSVKEQAQKAGVNLTSLAPRIDVQRQSTGSGAVSLHEAEVPLRSKGSGSKKLISAAMQMQLHGGKNIALIDELEIGLEPHRIRGLIHRLKSTAQQVFATTHSPVVLRELSVASGELHVCKRDVTGLVTVQDLNVVPDIQRFVRSNAEAFLGSKIVACEGATEIGCLRAYDVFRVRTDKEPPVWALSAAYFNAGGASEIKAAAPKLVSLGYRTAALADNDAKDNLSAEDVATLTAGGVTVCQWDEGNSTERQLFIDMPWPYVPELLKRICANHESYELATAVDAISKEPRVASLALGTAIDSWPESVLLRQVIGDLAHKSAWIKRIDLSGQAFDYALPLLPDTSLIKTS
jgi:putative ATP-dependent endonuclease of OLD family